MDPWAGLSPLLFSGRNAAPSVSLYILADSPSMASSHATPNSLDLAAAAFTGGSFGDPAGGVSPGFGDSARGVSPGFGDDDGDFEAAEWGDCGGGADVLGGNGEQSTSSAHCLYPNCAGHCYCA